MKDKIIEIIKSKDKKYIIFQSNNGFYCVVEPTSKIKYLKEKISDYLGVTYKHPQFLNNFYYQSIDSVRFMINVSMNL